MDAIGVHVSVSRGTQGYPKASLLGSQGPPLIPKGTPRDSEQPQYVDRGAETGDVMSIITAAFLAINGLPFVCCKCYPIEQAWVVMSRITTSFLIVNGPTQWL